MNLAELLEYCAKDFLDDRQVLVDGDNDDLWSDAYLVRVLNEAQRILCRRSWVIIETGVAPAGQVVLATGKVVYPLHKSVLRVFDAVPSTQTALLGRTGDAYLRDTSVGAHYPYDAFSAWEVGEYAARAGTTTDSGAPTAIASDAGTRAIRIYPPPAAAQNGVVVSLKIARLPITYLTTDDMEASPEVPEDYHMAIAEFAAGKALTLPNVDADQKVEGRRLLEAFAVVVKEARQERQRAEMHANRWAFSSDTARLDR